MKTTTTLSICLFFIISSFGQSAQLDVNNIKATINPSNVMFQTLAPDTIPYFETITGSGMSTIYASSLWALGTRSTDTAIVGSFQSYITPGVYSSYTTGPLTVVAGSATNPQQRDFGAALTDSATQAGWNKVFCVERWEINLFLRWYKCAQSPSCDATNHFPGYSIPRSITDWPAHGDDSKGQDYYMAPFYDNDADGVYDPLYGDYPCIKGDKYCWFVINDKTNSGPVDDLGIEVHTEVYSFNRDSLNPLSNTIFVGRDVINRSTNTYNNFVIGQFTDFDLGCHADDYVGSMPSLNSYYGYNADPIDDNCSSNFNPYGINPPSQGVTFLNQSMNSSMLFNNNTGSTGFPTNEIEAHRLVQGIWKDGTPLNYGGNGYPAPSGTSTSGVVTSHIFPYIAPSGMAPWTEITAGNPAGDRRMLGSVAPITLTPGKVHEIDVAYVFARSDSGNLKSVDKLYSDIQTVQAFYNDSIPTSCTAFILSEKEIEFTTNDVAVFPNPANNSITIENKTTQELNAEIIAVDGKVVISQFEVNANNRIDISKLKSGIYLIRVTNSNYQVIIKKLIKN